MSSIVFTAVAILLLLGYGKPQETQVDQDNPQIIFETPDIAMSYAYSSGDEVSLEAYRTKRTNEVLSRPGIDTSQLQPHEVAALTWVTPGICNFMAHRFHFTQFGLEGYILYLDNDMRTALARKASAQYGLTVTNVQILPLRFSKFRCTTSVPGSGGKRLQSIGKVSWFKTNPLKLVIEAFDGTEERIALNNAFERNQSISVNCETYANGKILKKNQLTIDFNQSGMYDFIDRLLGPANEVFVTRHQLGKFALNIFTMLNIEEEYEISAHRFKDEFIDMFIGLASSQGFQQVPIETALNGLAKFTTDFGEDLTPDIIEKDLRSLYNVKTQNSETHIVVDDAAHERLQKRYRSTFHNSANNSHWKTNSQSRSGSGGLSVGIGDIKIDGKLSTGGSSGSASSNNSAIQTEGTNNTEVDIEKSIRLANNELQKLNSHVANQVEFEFNGKRVVPKSITVAKFVRTEIRRHLNFKRIFKEVYAAPYYSAVHMEINANNVLIPKMMFDDVEQKIANLSMDIAKLKIETATQLATVRTEFMAKANALHTTAVNHANVKHDQAVNHANTKTNQAINHANGKAGEAINRAINGINALRNELVGSIVNNINALRNELVGSINNNINSLRGETVAYTKSHALANRWGNNRCTIHVRMDATSNCAMDGVVR